MNLRRIKHKRAIAVGLVLCIGFIFVLIAFPYVRRLLPPTTSDESILTQRPCRVPCWQGLTPGVSTRDSVKKLIDTNEFIPIWDIEESQGYLRWYWTSYHNGIFRFDDTDTLVSMEIYPNFQFPIREVINIYGEPEAIHAQWGNTNTIDVPARIRIHLYFPKDGMIIDAQFESSSADSFAIPTDLRGYGYKILDNEHGLEGLVRSRHHLDDDELSQFITDELILGWPGFGAILTFKEGEAGFTSSLVTVTLTP